MLKFIKAGCLSLNHRNTHQNVDFFKDILVGCLDIVKVLFPIKIKFYLIKKGGYLLLDSGKYFARGFTKS